ncbi:unnamed protein product [Brassica napus]|uniref:(rape) hypothetical protein n=1 Tax=Brassica napus TaxID=3708 RepID=A0A816TEK3_BRANA|nr:unnamed protein product [Brassica napus]
MGRKGEKRREKNHLAAHGGPARLPPPPDRFEARFTSFQAPYSTKQVVEKKENNSKGRVDAAAKV